MDAVPCPPFIPFDNWSASGGGAVRGDLQSGQDGHDRNAVLAKNQGGALSHPAYYI